MSIEAVTWALGADVGDSTRKLVLIGFANHAHRDGRHSWAAKDTIASYANCHVKTVRRHVQVLLAEGWLREGDQQQVAHLRADRRPVVYDVALDHATRAVWKAAAASVDQPAESSIDEPAPPASDVDEALDTRGDSLSGRHAQRGDNVSPRSQDHGGTQPCPSRGDTAVSPEPSLNQKNPPNPPPAGGASCAKPGPAPHPNCRGCGTTNRQLAATAAAEHAEQRRRAGIARLEQQRQAELARRAPVGDRRPDVETAIAATRRRLRESAGVGA